jgi:hypothetical protein
VGTALPRRRLDRDAGSLVAAAAAAEPTLASVVRKIVHLRCEQHLSSAAIARPARTAHLGGVFNDRVLTLVDCDRRYELTDAEWNALSRYRPSAVTDGRRPRVYDRGS